MPHDVTLVLIDTDGKPLGALPPFAVSDQWWPEVAEVVGTARDRYGVQVEVLRLLDGSGAPSTGDATYLAQTGQSAVEAATPVEVDLTEHPRRAAYARPGGPAATLAWARAAVERLDRGPVLETEQRRTWNLSAIWRLRTTDGPLWIKEVPHFFGHESAVLRWLAGSGYPQRFPVMLATDGPRMLLADIPGRDLYDATPPVLATIATDLHPVQIAAVSHVDSLLAAGVPDGRFARMLPRLAALASGRADPALDRLVDGLAVRFAAAADCGLPDTLVHGDLHPGNVRAADGGPNVIIDWGDSFVGHPAFDILRLTEFQPAAEAAVLRHEWADRWRADVPGCDPERAVELLRPVAALRLAAVYVHFLANIEPSEYPYHADDPAVYIARAIEFAGAEA
jgi:aminoglycoside phosphotransferase (APT) family kinase protein